MCLVIHVRSGGAVGREASSDFPASFERNTEKVGKAGGIR